MKTFTVQALPLAAALAYALVFTGCSRESTPPATDAGAQAADDGFVTRITQRVQDKVNKKMEYGNISVGGAGSSGVTINGFHFGTESNGGSDLPKAEISPQGDLLIDGKAVTVDDTQRQLVLAHRANVMAIAEAGIAIGMQGAQLGAQAAKGAITSALAGRGEEFEARMQAEAAKIEAEAVKLCDHMPALLASQQALAVAVPAFQPYATLDASDVEDCRKDAASGVNPAAEADVAAEVLAQ